MATFTDNGGGAPNGSDLEFTYTFPILQTEDVKVALNNVVQATTNILLTMSATLQKLLSTTQVLIVLFKKLQVHLNLV